MKKIIALLVMVVALFGCSTDAEKVTYNIKQDAEQFKIIRRVIFMNNITGEYLFEAEGNCSVETNTQAGRLELTCKVGEDKYKVHYFGLSDNTSYIVEQMEWKEENKYRYKIIFKPESIIPIEFDVEQGNYKRDIVSQMEQYYQDHGIEQHGKIHFSLHNIEK